MSVASSQWAAVAGASKKATVVPGNVGLDLDAIKAKKQPWQASVSLAGKDPLAFTPYFDQLPASNTVQPKPGLYGSVAAAQDVCARDLACLGVRSHESGTHALLYPGCSKPKVITDLRGAVGSTTWVASRK